MLEFEVEALFLELAVLGSIEAVETGGTAGDVLFDFIGFGQNAEFDHFFAEVSFIEGLLKDEFVEVLELGEGEFFWEKFEADGLVADFSTEALAGELEDFAVIEGEGREVIEGEPGGGGGMLDELRRAKWATVTTCSCGSRSGVPMVASCSRQIFFNPVSSWSSRRAQSSMSSPM